MSTVDYRDLLPKVTAAQREDLLRQKGCVVWFTGLSGSGKTTLATALESRLHVRGHLAFILDGDRLREGLCRDLGFSEADRNENIRRLAETAALFADCGVLCLTAFISPLRAAREEARRIIGPARFLEIHVAASLAVCEARDVKGLYKKAREGAIPEFTGISSPYEPPEKPDLRLDTGLMKLEEAAGRVVHLLEDRGMLLRREPKGFHNVM